MSLVCGMEVIVAKALKVLSFRPIISMTNRKRASMTYIRSNGAWKKSSGRIETPITRCTMKNTR